MADAKEESETGFPLRWEYVFFLVSTTSIG